MQNVSFGPLADWESSAVLTGLRRFDDPGRTAADLPWAAAVVRDDGSAAATCSTMLSSGLFWALHRPTDRSRPTLVVGTDPAAVAHATGRNRDLDRDYLASLAGGHMATPGTPFTGVRRIPAGQTLLWSPKHPDTITQTTWCGPDTVGEPWLQGPAAIAEFTSAVDAVVAALAQRTPVLAAAISGGLDSTFVAAALVRGTASDRVIHGFCHRPLGHPDNSAHPRWDPDDWPWAQQFAAAYPDRIRLAAVTNQAGIHPLDAAARTADLCGIPAYSPNNRVWSTALTKQASALGATVQFNGQHGNAAFSHPHGYAARYYAARADLPNLWGLVRDAKDRDQPLPTRVRRHLLGPLRHPTGPDRAGWLHYLLHRSMGNAALANPAALGGVLSADPFNSRTVLELAAAITPREWQRGPNGRGFARRAGNARIPDPIRLRTNRGGQSWDAPDQWRADPARANLAMDHLANTPWLGDDTTLTWARGVVDDLFTTPPGTGYSGDLNRLARLLGVAEFVHRWS